MTIVQVQPEVTPLLSVRQLSVEFASRPRGFVHWTAKIRAVNDISFDVVRGTTLGIVGESGCGKTTLGRAILRLVPACGGEVWFDGTNLLKLSPAKMRRQRRELAIMFQDPYESLNPRLAVGTSIEEPLHVHGLGNRTERRSRVVELLKRVGLPATFANRYPHELSGGQRQRVCIARALALTPKLIVCDEAVSALDVSVQAQILNLLADLQRDLGLTYLFISHNLSVVEHISDRVAVTYLGKIVELADAVEIYRNPRHPYTQALLAAAPQVPESSTSSILVRGEPPDPAGPPSGCSFHPRCPLATDQCRTVAPSLQGKPFLTHSHLVSCHFADSTLDAPTQPESPNPHELAGSSPSGS